MYEKFNYYKVINNVNDLFVELKGKRNKDFFLGVIYKKVLWYYIFGIKNNFIYIGIKNYLESKEVDIIYFRLFKLREWFMVGIVKVNVFLKCF